MHAFHPSRLSLLWALGLTLATMGCGSGTAQRSGPTPVPQALSFQNRTPDPVRVYLVEGRSEWLLGYVEPMRSATLRLPPDIVAKPLAEITLVAVPWPAPRYQPHRQPSTSGAVRSVPAPASTLFSMTWRLAGRQLVSTPKIPRGR